MSKTLAFLVAPGTVEGLDFALSERRKFDPATPSRDAYLATVVEKAVAAELERLSAANPKLKAGKRA